METFETVKRDKLPILREAQPPPRATFMWIWLAVYWLTAVALALALFRYGRYQVEWPMGPRVFLRSGVAHWLGAIALALVVGSTVIHARWLNSRR
jgi:hypothetical protein